MEVSSKPKARSRELAISLYERWVNERRARPGFKIPQGKEQLQTLAKENFITQLAEPRRRQLKQLSEVAKDMSMPYKAALLVMSELPALEVSTLLHRLNEQVSKDFNSTYFSKVNMADNCGCGCGCGCAAMADLPWDEQIGLHMRLKPFSIDPFNEVGIPEHERDSLLIRDFLRSFERLSDAVGSLNKDLAQTDA
jgi:hypothetical protein